MPALSRRSLIIGGAAVVGLGAIGATYAVSSGGGFKEYEASDVFVEDGAAIRGTDPVAYFTEKMPVAGSPSHTLDWRGATWRFASAEHREMFEADPENYAPQYGGFCAWAIAEKDKLYSTAPENWSIVDGKLYLNYNDDIQAKWEQDEAGFIEEGDRNWRARMDARS